MTSDLDQYLNKTILVGLPALYGDVTCRACRLVGIDLAGLRLEVSDLTNRLLPAEAHSYAPESLTIFVPYAQISCVVASVPNAGAAAPAGKKAEQKRKRST